MHSTGWKDITLKIHQSDEEIVIPVMTASKVADVKRIIAEMVGLENPWQIEFLFKNGPCLKRQRNTDEVQSRLIVKGIKNFSKISQDYPHPYVIVGAGHFGLRQSIEYVRRKIDFVLFERKARLGGNAWAGIANKTSKLQSEGPHYQLQYDITEGLMDGLVGLRKYGYWPKTSEIIDHFYEVTQFYGAFDSYRLSTEVVDMDIIPEKPGEHFSKLSYDLHWKSTKEGNNSTGVFKGSCICFYPGALVNPHRKTWPGEDAFGGNIGYGFNNEFDYSKVRGERGIIIGMGSFSHENVRTTCEFGIDKVYVIARHFNLMLPRMVCWWMNQSCNPPTAAMALNAMEPMYKLCGLDPWGFFSVTANEDRTVANIKQYTRWGISDIFFIANIWGKCEVINTQVKRFKHRAVVLENGQVLEDIDHVCKVIGFDGDFGIDKINKTKAQYGPWPDQDIRRFIQSDMSAIDASRFGSVSLSPGGVSFSYMSIWYQQHPWDGWRLCGSHLLSPNKAVPESGSPAYHFKPREGVAATITVIGFCPEINEWEGLNNWFKKKSMHAVAPPDKYLKACKEDWDMYCKMFSEQGCKPLPSALPYPHFPYTEDMIRGLLKDEEEVLAAQDASRGQKKQQEGPAFQVDIRPGSDMSFHPARHVLRARSRSASPTASRPQREQWLAEAKGQRDWFVGMQAEQRKALK